MDCVFDVLRRNTVRARTTVSRSVTSWWGFKKVWDLLLSESFCDSPLKFNDFLMRNLWFLVVKKLKLFEMAKTGSLDSHFPMVWISWRKRPTSWLPAKRDTRWELNLYEKGFCIFRYMIDEYIWLVIYWHMRQWKRVFYTDSSMLRHTDIAYDMICKTIHLINDRSSCDILMI